MRFSACLLILFLIPLVKAACVTPELTIQDDTIFCTGNYSIGQSLTVQKSNISLDCNYSAVSCASQLANGIEVNGLENVSLLNCMIQDCQNGLYLKGVKGIVVRGSVFANNKIGVAVEDAGTLFFDDNSFQENGDSFYSIRSLIDEKSLLELNRFDKPPVIQELGTKGEEVENVEATEEPEINQTEVMSVEINSEDMRKILSDIIEIQSPSLSKREIDRSVADLVSRYFNLSRKSLQIQRIVSFNGSETVVTIEITPRANLTNVSFYESIPKCVAEYVAQIVFLHSNYEVIRADPLVVWHFRRLDSKTRLSYSVKKQIPEDCKKLLLGIGIHMPETHGTAPEQKWEVAVAIVIIPLIILIVIYFNRFRDRTD